MGVDVVSAGRQGVHFGPGRVHRLTGLRPQSVGLLTSLGQGADEFFAGGPSVGVRLTVQLLDLGSGPLTDEPGAVLGLGQAVLCALDRRLGRGLCVGDEPGGQRGSLGLGALGVGCCRFEDRLGLGAVAAGLRSCIVQSLPRGVGDAGQNTLELLAPPPRVVGQGPGRRHRHSLGLGVGAVDDLAHGPLGPVKVGLGGAEHRVGVRAGRRSARLRLRRGLAAQLGRLGDGALAQCLGGGLDEVGLFTRCSGASLGVCGGGSDERRRARVSHRQAVGFLNLDGRQPLVQRHRTLGLMSGESGHRGVEIDLSGTPLLLGVAQGCGPQRFGVATSLLDLGLAAARGRVGNERCLGCRVPQQRGGIVVGRRQHCGGLVAVGDRGSVQCAGLPLESLGLGGELAGPSLGSRKDLVGLRLDGIGVGLGTREDLQRVLGHISDIAPGGDRRVGVRRTVGHVDMISDMGATSHTRVCRPILGPTDELSGPVGLLAPKVPRDAAYLPVG